MTTDAAPFSSTDHWHVVCLCAAWCGVCREYRALFDALAAAYPQVHFAWVDVEDDEDVMGDVDVQTFPTLLIADGQQAHFLGALPPQRAVLERLLLTALQGDKPAATVSPEAQGLWLRLQATRS